MISLHGGGGGESPAGATFPLILNWVDGSLGSPVNGSRKVTGGKLGNRVMFDSWFLSKMFFELDICHG